MNDDDDLEHVAYLGSLVVGGMLYRGDVLRDEEGRYWAEHTLTNSDGSWKSALHRVDAGNDTAACDAALRAVMEYLFRQGVDLSVMTIVHHVPSAEALAAQIRQSISAPALLQ